MSKDERLTYERTQADLVLKFDGMVIAKRGRPDSEKAETWISLEPCVRRDAAHGRR